MKTYALIPARMGSKGVKNKNIRILKDMPLIGYSIEAALKTKAFDRVIVSTDSKDMAELSRQHGAEVPFLRPSMFAQDHSPDRAYIDHAIYWFQENEGEVPDLIALLRPTTPLRDPAILNQAVNLLKSRFDDATSLRSVHPMAEPPQKMLQIKDGWLSGFFPDDPRDDYFNLPRQTFPTAYQPNGYIDIVKTRYIQSEKEKIFGSNMIGFETPFSIEIDREEDFEYLEYTMEKKHEHF